MAPAPSSSSAVTKRARLDPEPSSPSRSSSSAANPPQHTNIWQLMNYPIPRGRCKHKPSLLAASCPCLRFMLNPLQAASSYACDGCGHHASFHNLKSDEEPEEVRGIKRGVVVDLSDDDEEEPVQKTRRIANGEQDRRSSPVVNGKERLGNGGKRVRGS